MKHSNMLVTCAIGIVSGVGTVSAVSERLQAAPNALQQTILTTSSVVVVVIPGFPVESIAIGAFVGLAFLVMVRIRRLRKRSTPRVDH